MKFYPSLIVPLVLMTQGFTLVITHKDGTKTEFPTEAVDNISFREDAIAEAPVFTIAIDKVTETEATVTFASSGSEDFIAGIVAESDVKDDESIISFIKGDATSQRREITGEATVTFKGLAPGTSYVVAAFTPDATDEVAKNYVRTINSFQPGTTGSVFAPGVSATAGFVDVDKVGDTSKYGWPGNDGDLCWATTAAGLIQWWLNDYEAKTGHSYPLKYPLPETSACYSTPVMDVINSAYNFIAGEAIECFQWFFNGVEENFGANGTVCYKESYKYWKGDFMGMTPEQTAEYVITNEAANNGYDDPVKWKLTYSTIYSYPSTADVNEVAKAFSDILLDCLAQGPGYLCFNGQHALSCWGADYKVRADGTPVITHLYIAENDNHPSNTRNGLEKCPIAYEYNYRPRRNAAVMTTPIGGKQAVTLYCGIRGWQGD